MTSQQNQPTVVYQTLQHKSVKQGPSPHEWEEMKDHIHRIYITEAQPLKTLKSRMESDYGFQATTKMYTTYFKKMTPLFNSTRNSGPVDGRALKVPRTRPRRLRGRLQGSGSHQAESLILPNLSFDLRLLGENTKPMAVKDIVEVYVYGLFDTFDFSSSKFDVIVPPGLPDNSLIWQRTADECFGAAVLMSKGDFTEGFRTFNVLCQRLKNVLGSPDCSMIIKFWRICFQLYSLGSQLGSFSIPQHFLRYFWELSIIRYPPNHPIPKLLQSLCNIPVAGLDFTLEIGSLRTIECLQDRLGIQNAVVLSTRSNYSKTCTRYAPSADELLAGYGCVPQEAERSFAAHGRTIEILHGYIYAAYYNAGDYALTTSLALDLVSRVESLLVLCDHPKWCLIVQGYALAVKLLYIMSRSTGYAEQGTATLKLAVPNLQRGDRECQTRADMLADIPNGRNPTCK